MSPMVGCMVVLSDDGSIKHDTFTITDPNKGNIYKFKTLDEKPALEWCRHLDKASRCTDSKVGPTSHFCNLHFNVKIFMQG